MLCGSHKDGTFTDKEAWRATAEELFTQQAAAPADTFIVEEFWGMDCLNHGRSAVSNDARLGEYADGFSKSSRPYVRCLCELRMLLPPATRCSPSLAAPQWARASHKLFYSGLIAKGTTLVGVGHSAGACAM